MLEGSSSQAGRAGTVAGSSAATLEKNSSNGASRHVFFGSLNMDHRWYAIARSRQTLARERQRQRPTKHSHPEDGPGKHSPAAFARGLSPATTKPCFPFLLRLGLVDRQWLPFAIGTIELLNCLLRLDSAGRLDRDDAFGAANYTPIPLDKQRHSATPAQEGAERHAGSSGFWQPSLLSWNMGVFPGVIAPGLLYRGAAADSLL
jgi:hypothetical protein